jgi:hypothetical protein
MLQQTALSNRIHFLSRSPPAIYSLSSLLHSVGVADRAPLPHGSHAALEWALVQKSVDSRAPPGHAALPLSTIAYQIVFVIVMLVGAIGPLRGTGLGCCGRWIGDDDGSVAMTGLVTISLG